MITVITVISRTGSNNIILEIIRYIEDTTLDTKEYNHNTPQYTREYNHKKP